MSKFQQSTNASTDQTYLFTQLLAGNESASRKVYPQLMPYLRKVARKKSNGLPDDLIDDVVSETWLIALKWGPRDFDPAKGSAKKYLCTVMKGAVKAVRGQYAPPGQKTRIKKQSDEGSKQTRPHKIIYLDDLQDEFMDHPREMIHDQWTVESKVFAKSLLTKIENPERDIFKRVYLMGETQRKVAEDLGISRFKVNRMISNTANIFQEDLQYASTASGWN